MDRRPHKAVIELEGATQDDMVEALALLASWAIQGNLSSYLNMGANAPDGSSFALKLEYSDGNVNGRPDPRRVRPRQRRVLA